ncbi:MAG: hypothetical protein KGI70_00890 [Patescibacteria group bacterium]|nr:hypothetical protein [Patescibacteria group bacterium]
MNLFAKYRTGLLAVVLVLCLVIAYLFYMGGPSTPALSTVDTSSPVSSDLLAVLGSLHTIQLDQTIFTNPVFVSLSDFGVTIPPENVGRRNPFAPVGAQTQSQTKTQPGQ